MRDHAVGLFVLGFVSLLLVNVSLLWLVVLIPVWVVFLRSFRRQLRGDDSAFGYGAPRDRRTFTNPGTNQVGLYRFHEDNEGRY